MAITEILQAAAPIEVLYQRLEYHTRVGGRLEKLKLKFEPDWDNVGKKDLPILQIHDFSFKSSIFPGAGRKPGTNPNIQPEMKVTFFLAVDRDRGLYRRSNVDTDHKTRGLLDWLEHIQDALEIETDAIPADPGPETPAVVDKRLRKTCDKPFDVDAEKSDVDEVSWGIAITVTIFARETIAGTRSDTISIVPGVE